jgi:hypothetical protein
MKNRIINKKILFSFIAIACAISMIVLFLIPSDDQGFSQNIFGSTPFSLNPLYFNGYNETFEDDYTPILEYDDTGWLNPTYNIDTGTGETWLYEDRGYTQNDQYAGSRILSAHVEDYKVSLYIDGALDGDDKGNDDTLPSSDTDTYWYYGGSDDTWGLSLTEADVEDTGDTGFGVCLKYYGVEGDKYSHYLIYTKYAVAIPDGATIEGVEVGVDAYTDSTYVFVDHVMMKIYYSEVSGKGPAVPDEYWYNFTGTGNTTDDYAHTDNMSLYLNLTGNEVGNFTWNITDNYYEYDMYFALGENHSTIRVYPTCNSTDNLSYLPYILINTTSSGATYDSDYDLDDDGDVDEWEIDDLLAHDGETGDPGWIKEDMNADGICNYVDVSWFVSHRVMTVQTNAYFILDQSSSSFYYNGSTIYGGSFSYRLNSNNINRYSGDLIWHRLEIYFPVMAGIPFQPNGTGVLAMFNEQEDNALISYDGLIDINTTFIHPWGLYGNVTDTYGKIICMQTGLMFTTDDISDFYLDDLSLLETPNDILDVDEYPANGSTDVSIIDEYAFELNMTDTQNPILMMDMYVWNGAGWDELYGGLRLDDYSFEKPFPYGMLFNTTYYWYVNITTYPDAQWSWEFPTSGTTIDGKQCYSFTTEVNDPPTIEFIYPTHNPNGIYMNPVDHDWWNGCSPMVNFSFNISDANSNDNYYMIYQWDTDEDEWVMMYDITVADYSSIELYQYLNLTLGDTAYVYIETEDEYGATAHYPNSTQNGVFVGGKKALRFYLEEDDPPYVSSMNPANNTAFNPFVNNIYINISDNNTGQPIWYNIYLYNEYGDHGEIWYWKLDGYADGNASIIITPEDHAYGGIWGSFYSGENGTVAGFRVRASNMEGYLCDTPIYYYFPSNGTGYRNVTLSPSWYYMFTIDYDINITGDTIQIDYPADGWSYGVEWRDNHDLLFTANMTSQTSKDYYAYLVVSVSIDDYTSIAKAFFFGEKLCELCPSEYNTTGSYDLKELVPFDDMRYNITLQLTYNIDGFVYPGDSDTHSFVIGSLSSSEYYHIAVKDSFPPHMTYENLEYLTTPISCNIAYALTDSSNDTVRIYSVLTDADGNHMLGSVYYSDIKTPSDWQAWWIVLRNVWKPYILPNKEYNAYFGISLGNGCPLCNENTFLEKMEDYQIDALYDDVKITRWTIISYYQHGYTNWYAHDGWYLHQGSNYWGWMTSFGYYPEGYGDTGDVNTNTGSDWANMFSDIEQDLFPGARYVFALIIIALFGLMPIIVTRKYQKELPLPVLLSFILMGVILAFGMGIIELWIMIIPTIIILLLLVYNIVSRYVKPGAESFMKKNNGGEEEE